MLGLLKIAYRIFCVAFLLLCILSARSDSAPLDAPQESCFRSARF